MGVRRPSVSARRATLLRTHFDASWGLAWPGHAHCGAQSSCRSTASRCRKCTCGREGERERESERDEEGGLPRASDARWLLPLLTLLKWKRTVLTGVTAKLWMPGPNSMLTSSPVLRWPMLAEKPLALGSRVRRCTTSAIELALSISRPINCLPMPAVVGVSNRGKGVEASGQALSHILQRTNSRQRRLGRAH